MFASTACVRLSAPTRLEAPKDFQQMRRAAMALNFDWRDIQPNVLTLSTGKSTRAGDPRPRRLRIEAAAPLIGRGSTFAIRAEAVRQREAYLRDERKFGSRPIRCSCIAARVAAK
jgi:hypothetical protein